MQAVLAKLQKARIQADIDKCKLYMIETKYLRLIISTDSIKIDFIKIETICT